MQTVMRATPAALPAVLLIAPALPASAQLGRSHLRLMPDFGMFEYACHEGNPGLRNALSGARATEDGGH